MLQSDPPDRPRSPHSTGTTPSPLSNGAGSSSSDSPSPPRSSASPPDALRQLSLAGPSRGRKDGKQERTVPCAQCRKSRRVCRWLQDSRECERCRKLGLTCSGPQRRGRAALDDFSTDSALSAPEEPVVSLTCQLVEKDMFFATIGFDDFGQRISSSRGRTDELSSDLELLASIHFFFGAQFTSHSGILGSDLAIPGLEVVEKPEDITKLPTVLVGRLRHAPVESVADLILERVEALSISQGDLTAAINRLGLAWMAVEPLHGDQAREKQRLLGMLAQDGLPLLDHPDREGEAEEFLLFVLKGIVRDEMRHSVVSHTRLFGTSKPPFPSPLPLDLLGPFLFDPDPVPTPEKSSLFDTFTDECDNYQHHLEAVLTYSPSSRLPAAVKYVLNGIDRLTALLTGHFDTVSLNPCLGTLPPNLQAARPSSVLLNLLMNRLYSISTLYACEHALQRAAVSESSRQSVRSKLMDALSGVVDAVDGILPQPASKAFTKATNDSFYSMLARKS
ncbi:hypothetical protein JCM8547_006054 [Rhodosporidiobolus lusitaniae]